MRNYFPRLRQAKGFLLETRVQRKTLEEIMNNSKSPPMTVSEFSSFLRVSRHKVYEKIRRDEIPALHFGRRVLIDLDEALKSMRREGHKAA